MNQSWATQLRRYSNFVIKYIQEMNDVEYWKLRQVKFLWTIIWKQQRCINLEAYSFLIKSGMESEGVFHMTGENIHVPDADIFLYICCVSCLLNNLVDPDSWNRSVRWSSCLPEWLEKYFQR